ncbi:glycosyl hydrolase 115 family protein [Asticcacaulis machinosus]|uniref:Glycosyl hydrolase 115 family protein n=1 Tax=Asticcacaulis machinosus TaxID=2984211 RepID=A0ABT5HML0_9CAUL|nr:glycosyl hydrolase 115 family protein [Asticcacaulis machinosus]MDC7677458.1 glycosyl hydrolase 115 family protein [Asticcacaulis machinosus]
MSDTTFSLSRRDLLASASALGLILPATSALAASVGGKLAAVSVVPETSSSFPLVANGKAAPIILPANAPEVVKISARELAEDIAAVTGKTPEILSASRGSEPQIELQIAPHLAGRWEAYQLSAKPDVLTISGSDPRGLCYGMFEISNRIGVSPWRWWADVPAPQSKSLYLSLGEAPIDQPAVKYRGIFINDEDWGLEPWSSKTFEPEATKLGPKTYARIFTLMIRLRANYLWPGMHPTTRAFHTQPGNAAAADAHAIIVGSSHAEPMLLNNGKEWPDEKDKFNYLANRDAVYAYWEKRISERTSGESLITIGMRGINDTPIIGPKNQQERIATLEKVFADQRELLAKYLGMGDATLVAQMFCPYKEVLSDYNAGLRVPDDVTIVWPDDNFGYIRRYGNDAERARSGGLGVYYHASYSGRPLSWLWIDVMPPALIWSEMMRAYEHGSRTLWVVNVGDLKNTERSTEFFLDLAWHADRTDLNAPVRAMRKTAARDFGVKHGEAIASLLNRLQIFSANRRAEHLQWHLSLTPYIPTELNETEIEERLRVAAELLRDSTAIAASLSPKFQDAYFQLVHYPVAITEAANHRYFHSELARADVARNRNPAANLAAESEAQRRIIAATTRYNEKISGGKWQYIVTENGYYPKDWPAFQRDTTTPRPKPTLENVAPAAPPTPSPLSFPKGWRRSDFVERDKAVSINAGHFTTKHDLPSGAGWRSIKGLGRTGSAVTVLPSNTKFTSKTAPSLDYRFHVSTGGMANVRVRLLPTFPIAQDQGLRLAIAVDDGILHSLNVTDGFETTAGNGMLSSWGKRVLSNATEVTITLPTPLTSGWHILRLVAVDTGVVVDKIIIDFGSLPRSYDGPPETRIQ